MSNAGKVRINRVTIKMVREKYSYYETKTVRSPEDLASVFNTYLAEEDREHFVVACMNVKNEILNLHTVSIGSLNSAIVHPREVFKTAVLSNAASIAVCHNHPSGNVSPSPEDIEVTKRLVKAGELMGIDVLDHIIVGDGKEFTSLKEKGYM